jgi:hypothetical protein
MRDETKNRYLTLGVMTLLGLAAVPLCAQSTLVPMNAQSVLYFPHLTEGGPDVNNFWQATFTMVNTNSVAANMSLSFYNDDGTPMMLDFGSGSVPSLAAAIPANGSRQFRSQLTHKGPQPVWGWAAGQSDVPVFAQLNYRSMSNGQIAAELATNATTGTAQWTSMANPHMGIAVANPSPNDTMNYTVNVKDADGLDIGSQRFQLAPLGHDAFTLNNRFKSLSPDFTGSVTITGQTTSQSSYRPAMWTVGWESGAFATLPDGRALSPADPMASAKRVWGRILATAHQMGYQVNPILNLLPGTASNGIANAMGGLNASGNEQVTVYMSLVEMMGDSDGELAFIMAHQLGHVIQCKTACKVALDPQMAGNYESDADELGMAISTTAGYDSYSAAGAYSKLQMGNGQVSAGMMGSAAVWEDMTLSGSPQGFFAGRINGMYQVQKSMCANPMFQNTSCTAFKNLMHPDTGGMNMLM